MSKEIKGSLFIVAAAFFWGISGTIAKIIFNNYLDPVALVNMRMNLAFIIAFIYFFITNKKVLKINIRDIKYYAILGGIGIVGLQTTYYYTVSILGVSIAIFLQFLSPVIIMIYCTLFEKEKLSRNKMTALVFALIGSSMIIFGGSNSGIHIKTLGLITGLASAFFNAMYGIMSKKCTNRNNPWTVLIYSLGFGALFYWFVSPPWIIWKGISFAQLAFVAYIAIFATIVPYGLYMCGIRYLFPTTAGIIAMLEPVVASVSAYIILGELMNMKQMMGGILIISAVVIIQRAIALKLDRGEFKKL